MKRQLTEERIKLAKEYSHLKLEEYKDTIAVLLGGSTARGQAYEFSDIDLRFVCDIRPDERMERPGYDGWYKGVYFDAGPVSSSQYLDPNWLLTDLNNGSTVHDALVLYDSTGRMTEVCEKVKAEFCLPECISRRCAPITEKAMKDYLKLKNLRRDGDIFEKSRTAGQAIKSAVTNRLALRCQTSTSTRNLEILGITDAQVRTKILELEGVASLSVAETLLLHQDLFSQLPVLEARYGELLKAFKIKFEWMIKNGKHIDAAHWMWNALPALPEYKWQSRVAKKAAENRARIWLERTGWGIEYVAERIQGILEVLANFSQFQMQENVKH